MSNLDERHHTVSDHDLLLRLDERFESFQKSVTMMFDEIMRKHNEVMDSMRLKAEASTMQDVQRTIQSLDNRVSLLEKWRWWLMGAFTAAGIVGGVVSNFLINLI